MSKRDEYLNHLEICLDIANEALNEIKEADDIVLAQELAQKAIQDQIDETEEVLGE